SDIISRVSQKPSLQAVQRLSDLEARHLFSVLKDEQPQAIALVISSLTPAKASELMNYLRPDLRDQLVERIATLGPVPVEVLETLCAVLQEKLNGRTNRALNQSGGLKSAADVLIALNKN